MAFHDLFCHRPAAERGKAGRLAYRVLQKMQSVFNPGFVNLKDLKTDQSLRDMVSIKIDLMQGSLRMRLREGMLPWNYRNGRHVQESVRAIEDLEREAVDEWTCCQRTPQQVMFRTTVFYVWHERHSILTPMQSMTMGLEDTVIRSGVIPPRVNVQHTRTVPRSAADQSP